MKRFFVLIITLSFVAFIVCPAIAEEMEQTPVPAKDTASSVTEEASEGVVTGKVVNIDGAKGEISIKTDNGIEKTFSVVEDETILWRGIEDIKLSDISKDENVEVGYYSDDKGNLIASWVDVITEEPIAEVVPGAATENEQQ